MPRPLLTHLSVKEIKVNDDDSDEDIDDDLEGLESSKVNGQKDAAEEQSSRVRLVCAEHCPLALFWKPEIFRLMDTLFTFLAGRPSLIANPFPNAGGDCKERSPAQVFGEGIPLRCDWSVCSVLRCPRGLLYVFDHLSAPRKQACPRARKGRETIRGKMEKETEGIPL